MTWVPFRGSTKVITVRVRSVQILAPDSSVGKAPDRAIPGPGLESWLGMVCHYFSHPSVIDAVPTPRYDRLSVTPAR